MPTTVRVTVKSEYSYIRMAWVYRLYINDTYNKSFDSIEEAKVAYEAIIEEIKQKKEDTIVFDTIVTIP